MQHPDQPGHWTHGPLFCFYSKKGYLVWEVFFYFFLRFYLFIFRQRGREREIEQEKHQCVVTSCAPPTGDLVCHPGTCPDWELNQPPFPSLSITQSSEPHQAGRFSSKFTTQSDSGRGMRRRTKCHKFFFPF